MDPIPLTRGDCALIGRAVHATGNNKYELALPHVAVFQSFAPAGKAHAILATDGKVLFAPRGMPNRNDHRMQPYLIPAPLARTIGKRTADFDWQPEGATAKLTYPSLPSDLLDEASAAAAEQTHQPPCYQLDVDGFRLTASPALLLRLWRCHNGCSAEKALKQAPQLHLALHLKPGAPGARLAQVMRNSCPLHGCYAISVCIAI